VEVSKELDNYLETYIQYNPDSGEFFWKTYRGPNAQAGRQLTNTNQSGYYYVLINGKGYLLSRLAWYITHREFPPDEIDHINRNRIDNRIENLRCATRRENALNTRKKSNKTGLHNVYWCKREGRYLKYIRLDTGKKKYMGRAKTLEEASKL